MNQDILLHLSTEVCFYICVYLKHHNLHDHHMSAVWLSAKGQVKNIKQTNQLCVDAFSGRAGRIFFIIPQFITNIQLHHI